MFACVCCYLFLYAHMVGGAMAWPVQHKQTHADRQVMYDFEVSGLQGTGHHQKRCMLFRV